VNGHLPNDCKGSRADGQCYPRRDGVAIASIQPTDSAPCCLTRDGYDALVGTSPEKAGFDELLLWQEKSGDAKGSRYWGPTLTTNGKTKINTMGFGADIQNEFAVEYVEYIEWHRERLILLYYPMALIHLILRLAEIATGTTAASSIMAHVPQVV
jgi:hypothetical protein